MASVLNGSFTSGTCESFSGSNGLLQKLLDFVTGESGTGCDWVIKYQRNTRNNNPIGYTEPFGSDCKEVILQNTGLSGLENVLIGIREWKYVGGNAYGWDLTGYLSYSEDMFWGSSLVNDIKQTTYSTSYNHYTLCPFLPLIDGTMYYWFYTNKQRIAVFVKIQSNYESAYLGFGNRFASPSEYPYPLIIAGSASGAINITSTDETQHNFIAYSMLNSKLYNKCFVLPSNSWDTALVYVRLFPLCNWANTGNLYDAPTGREEILVSPIIGYYSEGKQTLWEYDGVYHFAGIGIQSEDMVKMDDGFKYRIFQNVQRVDYNDFIGIAEAIYTTTTTTITSTTV